MADAGAACPPHWYVARFSKLEKALERWIPTDIQAAPGERDQRPNARRPGASATPGVSDGPGPKISRWMRFAVIPQPARPSVTSCMKRAARICRSRHCAVSRAPGAHPCLNAPERQIPDPACLRERENCTRCGCGRGPKLLRERGLLGKRGLTAVAGSMEPPDFPRRRLGGQRAEHRQHWRCPDACAQ